MYETIDGQRVHKTVANAYRQLNEAFKNEWGLELRVSSGTRTREEQQRLYDGWKRRLPGFNLAAAPGQSNHEESGPSGPRALDVRDTGADAGVTVLGTPRSNWLRREAPKYGFVVAGARFTPREPWHIEYIHRLDIYAPAEVPEAEPVVMGASGLRWYGIQCMLKQHYGYTGPIDNLPGAGTIAAMQRFLKLYRNIAVDGIWGVETVKAMQTWLALKWGYGGAIDGIIGGATAAAWQRAETGNWHAFK